MQSPNVSDLKCCRSNLFFAIWHEDVFVPLSVTYFCSCYGALAMGCRIWGFESQQGKRFFSVGPSASCLAVQGLFPWEEGSWDIGLTTYLSLLPRLKVSGAFLALPLCVVMTGTGPALPSLWPVVARMSLEITSYFWKHILQIL
jgi:hypothetical protein